MGRHIWQSHGVSGIIAPEKPSPDDQQVSEMEGWAWPSQVEPVVTWQVSGAGGGDSGCPFSTPWALKALVSNWPQGLLVRGAQDPQGDLLEAGRCFANIECASNDLGHA